MDTELVRRRDPEAVRLVEEKFERGRTLGCGASAAPRPGGPEMRGLTRWPPNHPDVTKKGYANMEPNQAKKDSNGASYPGDTGAP